MSLSAKNDPDHSLNTLTDVVRLLGDTRHDVKNLDSKVEKGFKHSDEQHAETHKRFDRQDKEIAGLKADNVQLKADNTEIKEMLKALLSR